VFERYDARAKEIRPMKTLTLVSAAALALASAACSRREPVAVAEEAAPETTAETTSEPEPAVEERALPPEVSALAEQAEAAVKRLRQTMPSVEPYFERSVAYAIFPEITKGGLIVGGAHGKGLVYENGRPIGTTTLSAGSIGLQIGAQKYSEILFFENQLALVKFKQKKISLGARASGVFAEEGATSAKYHDGYAALVFGQSGLMGDASVGGQEFGFTPLP
jgi:hypothetical protein